MLEKVIIFGGAISPSELLVNEGVESITFPIFRDDLPDGIGQIKFTRRTGTNLFYCDEPEQLPDYFRVKP